MAELGFDIGAAAAEPPPKFYVDHDKYRSFLEVVDVPPQEYNVDPDDYTSVKTVDFCQW